MKSLVAMASAAALLMTVPAWAQNSNSPAQTSQSAKGLNALDKLFIKMAGDANLAESALGSMVMEKADTPAVKEFGRWMATDHGLANKRLLAIAKVAGDNQQPMLTDKDKALQEELGRASGSQFDTEYLTAMVQGHKMAIEQFQAEAQDGQNKQLRTYAENLIPVLQQHLAAADKLASASGMANAGSGARSGSSMPPPHVASGASKAPANVSSPEIKQVQQKLKSEGLYNGQLDGIEGPETKQALEHYQRKNNLQQTGSVDQQTLQKMGISQTEASGSSMPPSSSGPRPSTAPGAADHH